MSAKVTYQPNDFIFIKPGRKWIKVRECSKWNRERLSELSRQYCAVKKPSDKRSFVIENILNPVLQSNGRFLRGNETYPGKVEWYIMSNQEDVESELMRLLRQLRGSKFKNISIAHGLVKQGKTIVQQLKLDLDMYTSALDAISSSDTANGWAPRELAKINLRLERMQKSSNEIKSYLENKESGDLAGMPGVGV